MLVAADEEIGVARLKGSESDSGPEKRDVPLGAGSGERSPSVFVNGVVEREPRPLPGRVDCCCCF